VDKASGDVQACRIEQTRPDAKRTSHSAALDVSL
jgi:hypothetical protein